MVPPRKQAVPSTLDMSPRSTRSQAASSTLDKGGKRPVSPTAEKPPIKKPSRGRKTTQEPQPQEEPSDESSDEDEELSSSDDEDIIAPAPKPKIAPKKKVGKAASTGTVGRKKHIKETAYSVPPGAEIQVLDSGDDGENIRVPRVGNIPPAPPKQEKTSPSKRGSYLGPSKSFFSSPGGQGLKSLSLSGGGSASRNTPTPRQAGPAQVDDFKIRLEDMEAFIPKDMKDMMCNSGVSFILTSLSL